MNKLPVLALFSLLLVASISSAPLIEPSLSLENQDFNEDFTNHEEDFVLGSPSPQFATSGLCYQNCKKDTVSNCKNVSPSVYKKMTKGERNYCISICPLFNKNCG